MPLKSLFTHFPLGDMPLHIKCAIFICVAVISFKNISMNLCEWREILQPKSQHWFLHYLNQCSLRSMTPYGITKPRRVKHCGINGKKYFISLIASLLLPRVALGHLYPRGIYFDSVRYICGLREISKYNGGVLLIGHIMWKLVIIRKSSYPISASTIVKGKL